MSWAACCHDSPRFPPRAHRIRWCCRAAAALRRRSRRNLVLAPPARESRPWSVAQVSLGRAPHARARTHTHTHTGPRCAHWGCAVAPCPTLPDPRTCLRDRPVPAMWMVWRGRFFEFWADAQNSLKPISVPRDSTRTWSPTCERAVTCTLAHARAQCCAPQPVPCGAHRLAAARARCPCHTRRSRARPAHSAPCATRPLS